MNKQPEQYYAYLLRFWLVESNENYIWRVFLENIHTGERVGFASMSALIAFLRELENTAGQPACLDQPKRSSAGDKAATI